MVYISQAFLRYDTQRPRLAPLSSLDYPWLNVGLTLRWSVGLRVMEEYAMLSNDAINRFTKAWVEHVHGLISLHSRSVTTTIPEPGPGPGPNPCP